MEARGDLYFHFSALANGASAIEHAGVGVVFNKRMLPYIKNIGIINNRMIVISLHGFGRDYHIVNVYASQNGCDDVEKDIFYDNLQKVWNAYPERDAQILLGDLNARYHARTNDAK